MDQRILAEREGIAIYDGFEGASVGGFREYSDGIFHVDCLEEPGVPDIAWLGVFFDYTFCIGVRNTTMQPRPLALRLNLCERSASRNMRFMQGPWWHGRGRCWQRIPLDNHSKAEDWVHLNLTLTPEQDTLIATRPFWTEDEIKDVFAQYAEQLDFVTFRDIGSTAEGRKLWLIETEPRDERIFIDASLQGAEFCGDTVLHVLDWLGTRTRRTQQLLQRFQFALLPVPVPDTVAHGYSIMNAAGRCPMFDFGHASRGEPCAEEVRAIWAELDAHPPAMWLNVHVHPGAGALPKLNPVKSSWYRDPSSASRAEVAAEAILSVCSECGVVPIPLDKPEFSMEESSMVLAARKLGTACFCLQDYALTHEGGKALLIDVLDAALEDM